MEDTKQKAVTRGKRAQAFVTDPVVAEVLEALEAKYVSAWKATKTEETIKREQAYTALMMLEDFKTQINTFLADGRLAARQLEKEQA